MDSFFANFTVDILPTLLIVLGALAFTVSLVTEVIKNLLVLRNVPTDAVVIVLSLLITLAAFIAYMQYMTYIITWYHVAGGIIGAFFVAFIAMYGWTKFKALWGRFTLSNETE